MKWKRMANIAFLFCCQNAFGQVQQAVTLTPTGGSDVTLSGGIGLAAKGKNSFTSEHNMTSIFFGNAAYHYQISSPVAIGLSYKFLGSHSGHDLLRCHFVGPDFKFRYLMNDDQQALFLTITPGYLHYADRVKNKQRRQIAFNHGYFAADFDFGYEFALSHHLSMQMHADILTGRWGSNPNYQLIPTDTQYYNGEDGKLRSYHDPEYMFEPSLVFIAINMGIAYTF